jgi:hypothetical protein
MGFAGAIAKPFNLSTLSTQISQLFATNWHSYLGSAMPIFGIA